MLGPTQAHEIGRSVSVAQACWWAARLKIADPGEGEDGQPENWYFPRISYVLNNLPSSS